MMLEKAYIVICVLIFVSAFPHPQEVKQSKQNQEESKENNLPLAFSDDYNYYDSAIYDFMEKYYDCDGDICDGDIWGSTLNLKKNVELDNSSLDVTEDDNFHVDTTSLWEECAPSVPLHGRLSKFKSCYKWAQDHYGIFNIWYIKNVCNFRKRKWLGQDGEIDWGEVEEMFKKLQGFGEYLNSCIQWDGEWPSDDYGYYGNGYYVNDYYSDYRVEQGDVKEDAKGKDTKRKSEKRQSKRRTKNNSGKKKKGQKVGNKNENNDRKGNTNKAKNKKPIINRKHKQKKKIAWKKNKGRRNKGKKSRKNMKPNGMRYKREAAKDTTGKKYNKKKKNKKKKKKKQKKALNVIDLAAMPTDQTMERLKCIEVSVRKIIEKCGENILKNGLSKLV